jgi:hypothetical protein
MPTVAVTGKDAIKINGRLITGFADGDNAKITMPNELVRIKTGKNGNSIYGYNYSGLNAKLEMRLLRGCSDDKFLNGLLSQLNNNPSSFPLMQGEYDKNIGDGSGNLLVDIYLMGGGTFEKQPEVMENADGETNQAVVTWNLLFANVQRSLG